MTSKLLPVKYRIENIYVPETVGTARPDLASDESCELGKRRVVHVLGIVPPDTGNGLVRLRVLTEDPT